MENRIARGELYFVYLDPAFGRELGGYKTRPVVVVSINDIHRNTRVVTVVPGTTNDRPTPFGNVVRIEPSPANHLREITFFHCEQVRALDQGRMTARSFGQLSAVDFERVLASLGTCLGLAPL